MPPLNRRARTSIHGAACRDQRAACMRAQHCSMPWPARRAWARNGDQPLGEAALVGGTASRHLDLASLQIAMLPPLWACSGGPAPFVALSSGPGG